MENYRYPELEKLKKQVLRYLEQQKGDQAMNMIVEMINKQCYFMMKSLFDLQKEDPLNYKYTPRNHDQKIIEEIFQSIQNSNTVIDILEIGAGRTYPTLNHHFGPPVLSRILSLLFEDKINIIASDINNEVCQIIIDKESKKSYTSTTMNSYHSKINFTHQRLSASPSYKYGDQTIYRRPALDQDIEKSFFGLDIKSNVDFTKLRQHFSKNQFDYVFARHLGGFWPDQDKSIKKMIQSILKEEGKMLVSEEIGHNNFPKDHLFLDRDSHLFTNPFSFFWQRINQTNTVK